MKRILLSLLLAPCITQTMQQVEPLEDSYVIKEDNDFATIYLKMPSTSDFDWAQLKKKSGLYQAMVMRDGVLSHIKNPQLLYFWLEMDFMKQEQKRLRRLGQ